MKRYFTLLFVVLNVCLPNSGWAQVVVTPAAGGKLICTNKAVGGSAPGFTVIDSIVIRETHAADFANGNDTLVLKPPRGWKFWTGSTPTIAFSPALTGDFLTESLIYTQDSIVLAVTTTATTTLDTQWITGIQVQAQSTTAAPGYIYASRITGAIAGITLGQTGTKFGDLSLSPSAISGSNIVCINYQNTTYLSDTTPLGTWSSSNTGIATVNASGIVHGVITGSASITYTLPTSCSVTKSVNVIICEGVSQMEHSDNTVNLYPNPASDELNIGFKAGLYKSFAISNVLGQVVLRQKADKTPTIIDISVFPPGIYYMSLMGEQHAVVRRFMKL